MTQGSDHIDRREFCHRLAALGGMAMLAPLIEACSPGAPTESTSAATAVPTPAATGLPTSTATTTATTPPTATPSSVPPTTEQAPKAAASPTWTPDPALTTVALVATSDRTAGVRRALDLMGFNPVSGRQVLFKPNFNSADPAPGSTHEDVLATLFASMRDMGATSITLADRSGMGDTRRVMQRRGVFDLARTFNVQTVVLDELPEDAWSLVEGSGLHWSRGFPVPRMLGDAECIVQTCNLKTHRYGGHFTLSLKNSVGLVAKRYRSYDFMNELHGTDQQRRMIAEINTAYQPALIVLDGVEAFVKGGPATGTLAAPQVILAGTDRIAIDAVGVAILRLFGTTPEVSKGRIFDQEQIARAVELGLGVDAPHKIRFVTGDAASASYAARVMQVLQA